MTDPTHLPPTRRPKMKKAGLLLKRTVPAVAGAAAAALLLAGCGGASVNQVAAATGAAQAPCGTR